MTSQNNRDRFVSYIIVSHCSTNKASALHWKGSLFGSIDREFLSCDALMEENVEAKKHEEAPRDDTGTLAV